MIDSLFSLPEVPNLSKDLWIVANFKSNKNIQQALEWLGYVGPELRKSLVKVVVCPTFVCLPEIKKAVLVAGFPILVGAQDISRFDVGAYTGEVAGKLISEFVDFVLVGHSERRQNFQETDQVIAEKITQAKNSQIKPLLCVQNENTAVPDSVEIVAYEPIFAIGTGHPDTAGNANKVAGLLKKDRPVQVLYGGSVHSKNVEEFLVQDNIDGILLGRASLDPEEFLKIVKIANSLK
ncbi:MAG: triose-phosphate isomerase [Candidatus Daviesbacteria bacterium]|nr:triose-phosphate isomerase [Candidatus Daviesbacteria bacterium]